MAEKIHHELTDAEAAVLDAATEDATAEAGARGGEIAATRGGWFGGRKLAAWGGDGSVLAS
jgi:hypothetical protein